MEGVLWDQRSTSWVFAFLLAWDPKQLQKAFALVPISESMALELVAIDRKQLDTKFRWAELRVTIRCLLKAGGRARVVWVPQEPWNMVSKEKYVNVLDLAELVSSDPYEAMSESRVDRWLR